MNDSANFTRETENHQLPGPYKAGQSFALDSFAVENYYQIAQVALEQLKDRKEIYFLGENGDGKTLLLQAIVLAIKGYVVVSKEGVTDENSLLFAELNQKENKTLDFSFTDNAGQVTDYRNGHYKASPNLKTVFGYGVNRGNDGDPKDDDFDTEGYLTLFERHRKLHHPIRWLDQQELREQRLSQSRSFTFTVGQAKELLCELLQKNVTFDIDQNTGETVVVERGSEVDFFKLSEGYRTVMTWVTDLLARLLESQPYAKSIKEFQGVVLVDELGLHLHPRWAYDLAKNLRAWFPKIQWIFTTHSPVIVLGASADAVFYKLFKRAEGGSSNSGQRIYCSKAWTNNGDAMANSILTSPLFDLGSSGSRAGEEQPLKPLQTLSELEQVAMKAIEKYRKEHPNELDLHKEEVLDFVAREMEKLMAEGND